MVTCKHDFAEKEAACVDGMCPICMFEEIKRLRHELTEEMAKLQEKVRKMQRRVYV